MQERVDFHCQQLQNKNKWNDASATPSPYMQNIVQETTTLHRVLYTVMDRESLNVSSAHIPYVSLKYIIL
jgi:hypothetical protein